MTSEGNMDDEREFGFESFVSRLEILLGMIS